MAAAETMQLHQVLTPTGPARHGWLVTPDNANDLPYMARALYIGATAGNLVVTTASGEVLTLPVAAYSSFSLCMVKRVWATSTAASIWAFM